MDLGFAYKKYWGVIHNSVGTGKRWKWGENGLFVKLTWNLE